MTQSDALKAQRFSRDPYAVAAGANEIARLKAVNAELVAACEAQEAAETLHANCEECDGQGVPELCAVCFPYFDDARLKRRAAIARAQS